LSEAPWSGLRVRVHPLFWLMIAMSVWTGQFVEILTWFVLVVIHELGHVTAAWSFGWRLRSITLLPFGGVAQTDEWGTVPAREELAVALAGPFHHVIMVIVSFAFAGLGFWSEDWTAYFIHGNLMIACFNLLPVYPLDGGRIMQALLSFILPYRLAISAALWAGLVFSLGLLLFSPLVLSGGAMIQLAAVAAFMAWSNLMALKERHVQYLRFLLHRLDRGAPESAPVRELRLRGRVSLKKAVHSLCKERYHVVKVEDSDGRLLGEIPEEKLLEAFFRRGWAERMGQWPAGNHKTGS
jgi:stage IV sporulation protein FB